MDYTANVIKDVIVLGIVDPDIQKDVLAWEELDEKDDKAVVAFVETKELAQNAWMSSQSSAATAGLSSYRRETAQQSNDASFKAKLAMKGRCFVCKKDISPYKKYQSGGINKKPHTLCTKCFKSKAGQRSKVDAVQGSEGSGKSDSDTVSSFYLCANENEPHGAPAPDLQGGEFLSVTAAGRPEVGMRADASNPDALLFTAIGTDNVPKGPALLPNR